MILVLVESPTKAKAINEYLSDEKEEYVVLSTFGHIRDLIAKSGSIETENNYEYKWEPSLQWAKHKSEILKSAKLADKIILATDLDREGEGIAWHFSQILKENKIFKPQERVIFHSVSKSAIKEAFKNKQEFRLGLVEAYLARLGLDYLFGFSISPLLWRKVPSCRSAGRVQSVALRLVVEREAEIHRFKKEKYITIHAKFAESSVPALLTSFQDREFENGQIFKDFPDLAKITAPFVVNEISKQNMSQRPSAPFITSTLQQEASSKLNFPPAFTMQLAQKLYEGFSINGKHQGLITYMRTDNTSISKDAIESIRKKIVQKFGPEYLPKTPYEHKQKVKNAQEAHEAIRPVDINLIPETLNLKDDNLKALYKLIWEKALVSQMAEAKIEKINIKISGSNQSIFELKGSKIIFDGFKILQGSEREEFNFSKIKEGMELKLLDLFSQDHETQPPNRYSEASLIQQLEKKGIGRPSTYARIIQVLYERGYVKKEKKIISPMQNGWIVTGFLKHFFPEYVAYEFTSHLEELLDDISQGENKSHDHISVLDPFWKALKENIDKIKEVNPVEVCSSLLDEFCEYFSPEQKVCPKCGSKLLLKISKFGALFGCERYPDCDGMLNLEQSESKENKSLGIIDDRQVVAKNGPYGPYVEFIGNPPKRVSLPKFLNWDDLTLEHARFLYSLPLVLGEYEGDPVKVSIGRFGPFIQYNKDQFASVKDPFTLSFDDALLIIQKKKNSSKSRKRKDSENPDKISKTPKTSKISKISKTPKTSKTTTTSEKKVRKTSEK